MTEYQRQLFSQRLPLQAEAIVKKSAAHLQIFTRNQIS